ncbi:MAG TPA: hypothetical protein VK140_13100 [Ktedonobacteraceae bacterium]|nr:hypothetical protein [Ktedonobacteraceae bacterium]
MRKLDTPGQNLSYPPHTTTAASTRSTTPAIHPPGLSTSRRKRNLVPTLIVSSAVLVSAILVLASAGLGTFLPSSLFAGNAHSHPATPANRVVGHVLFSSSGQIRQDSSQGIADEVQLDLSNIPNPAAGKSYYAWLLNDDPVEGRALLLGRLQVNHSTAHLQYAGDAQHTNLLEVSNRLLITEEDAAIAPVVPSLDTSTWQFVAQFPQTPNPLDTIHHFSLLSHLRHLLALDPTLQALGMPGGLDIWLLRNTQKVLEWAGSARDDWAIQDTALMHRHIIRILDYLDGLTYVQNDVPAGTPVLVDDHIGRVGLLEFDVQNQEPPALLYHIGLHLHGLVQSPGASAEQKQLAIQIDAALNKVQALLEQVHQDAKQLVLLTGAQLQQPSSLSLLDDMVKHAQDAFVGQFDPTTGEIQDGITQIHYAIQRLAIMDVVVMNSTTTKSTPDQFFQLRAEVLSYASVSK